MTVFSQISKWASNVATFLSGPINSNEFMADTSRPKLRPKTDPRKTPTDSDTIVLRLRDFLELPDFIKNVVADHPVIASNFDYENIVYPLSAILFGTKEARILGTFGTDLRKSSSKLGDYIWIKDTDPKVDRAIFVVQTITLRRIRLFNEIY